MGAKHSGVIWKVDGRHILATTGRIMDFGVQHGIGWFSVGEALTHTTISVSEAEANAVLMASSLELFETLAELVNAVGCDDARCGKAQEIISRIVGERLK